MGPTIRRASEERVAARYALFKNAGPLTDVSKLRYQAVFLMGAPGSGKSFVAYRWLKYMPGGGPSGVSRDELEQIERSPKRIDPAERLLNTLSFERAVKALRRRGVEIEVTDTGDARIPFNLFTYDQTGAAVLLEPSEWENKLPPDLYKEVKGLRDLVFSAPKRELPSFWRQVSPDVYKEEIPGFDPKMPGYVHMMSTDMGKAYFEAAVETGDPLFLDGTGQNLGKMLSQVQTAKAHGYRVALVFVRVPLVVNQIRNATRTRNVDPDVVVAQWKLIELNFRRLSLVADRSRKIDNRNNAYDRRSYEQNVDKIEAFIRRETSYPNLRALIADHAPEELSEYPWLLNEEP